MSNKVIFNLDELFISVGIDVGADFSWMSIALPNQQFVGKPYKLLHNSIDSLTTAVSKIKEAEDVFLQSEVDFPIAFAYTSVNNLAGWESGFDGSLNFSSEFSP